LNDWFAEYGASLRAYALALVRDLHQADDLVQEVFARAWQSQDRYQERGQARAYLFRIADHVVCDWARKNAQASLGDEVWNLTDSTNQTDPARSVVAAETNQELYRALDKLSPVQRRILLLRYFGQCGFNDIAKTVGCPVSTALSHCHRGLELLRIQFRNDQP
jgi:RNA polymerase sigma-70 factor, ECF subfamily